MRQIILMAIALTVCATAFSQNNNPNLFNRFYNSHLKTSVEQKEVQLFAEVNPQFFAFKGYGGGLGVEFSRFQTGFIYLKTELTPTFRDAIFNDAQGLTVPKNAAAEIFVNAYLRKDRKGFYAGAILSYDWYAVTDNKTQKKEDIAKQYLVTRAGFRWFPFQEHVYIDGGYGVSFNLNSRDNRTLGNSNYSPKSILALPFIAVGGRVSLASKR